MIRKKKLIDKIKAALEIENRLIPLFNKHISSSLDFSKLKKQDKEAIIEKFQSYTLMLKKHINTLEDIEKTVEGGQRDVY
jgi:hypothetical protein